MADTAVGLHVDGCLFSHAEEDALVSALGRGAEDAYEILFSATSSRYTAWCAA